MEGEFSKNQIKALKDIFAICSGRKSGHPRLKF
jgi:hypothetical protein